MENIILSGIVGSTAYGLATEDSDIDRLGIFAARTESLLGLNPPKDSIVKTNPDITFHEAGKFVRLALSVNPTVTELLWLDKYETCEPLGAELIAIRQSFLSRQRVVDAYLGYAVQQFRRLESRGDNSFSSDTRKRTAKHARHLARLIHQGLSLYETGELTVKLNNPQWYLDFGQQVADGDVDLANFTLNEARDKFAHYFSPLPEHPNSNRVQAWLLWLRRQFYYGYR